MKPSKLTLGLFSAAIALFANSAMANTVHAAGSINAHQHRQEHRINQGVHNGSLTASEYARLQKGQYHIQRMENKVRADGHVTTRERARILHKHAIQSKHIYRLKHN